jgi:sarcosine oxidase
MFSAPLDVLIVGLGVMGSSSFYNLSSKELSVLGIDQYLPPHIHGSSHGETRIIRKLYFEHPLYVKKYKKKIEYKNI